MTSHHGTFNLLEKREVIKNKNDAREKTGKVHRDEDLSVAPKGFQNSRNFDHCLALDETSKQPLCHTYSRLRSKTQVDVRPYALRLIVAGLKPWRAFLPGFDGKYTLWFFGCRRNSVEF